MPLASKDGFVLKSGFVVSLGKKKVRIIDIEGGKLVVEPLKAGISLKNDIVRARRVKAAAFISHNQSSKRA